MEKIFEFAVFDGWFWVAIMIPIALPIVASGVWKIFVNGSTDVLATVKDAQLGWIVVGLGASGCYETWESIYNGLKFNGAGALFFGAVLLVGFGAVLAVGGANSPTREPSEPLTTWLVWVSHYRLFLGSVVLTLFSAILFTVIHYKVDDIHRLKLHGACKAATDNIDKATQLPLLSRHCYPFKERVTDGY